MSTTLLNRLESQLQKRLKEGNLRVLGIDRAPIDFFSNDYLGLAQNEALRNIVKETYNKKAKVSGATGSRLLSGNSEYYQELESKLAVLFKGEASLIFNSGYTANLAIFSALPQKGDTIIYDELIHACIKEGSRLSFADRFSFKHNDPEDLENKLRKAKGEKFVALESIYSMDGDFAPLEKLIEVCKKYSALIILDEAHATGVFGDNGNGLACSLGLEKDIIIRTFTFGKAIGSHGACVVAEKTIVQYLINFARPFIFTTALPLHNLISIESAFDYIRNNKELQKELKNKISFFRDSIGKIMDSRQDIQLVKSESSIQAIIVGGNTMAKALSTTLISNGFDVRPILSPTVPVGKERVRICLHVYNSFEEIEGLISIIKNFSF